MNSFFIKPNPTFQPSAAMRISIEQQIYIGEAITDLTWKRNEGQFASYEETVIHVMLTCPKGGQFSIWRLANGKFVRECMLDRMVADGLMKKQNPRAKRNMYNSPTWTRTF